MIARIRFYVNKDGDYHTKRIRFRGNSIIPLAEQIEAFCSGYHFATGLKALIEGVEDISSSPSFDFEFDDKKKPTLSSSIEKHILLEYKRSISLD